MAAMRQKPGDEDMWLGKVRPWARRRTGTATPHRIAESGPEIQSRAGRTGRKLAEDHDRRLGQTASDVVQVETVAADEDADRFDVGVALWTRHEVFGRRGGA